MRHTQLSKFNNDWFNPGRSALVRLIWHFVNSFFFFSFLPGSGLRVFILKLFGAEIGKGCVIKPYVSVKFPWRLKVGDFCWIGEQVWIDNLEQITIGNNVCISQGALLITGNHNYKSENFDLVVKPIFIDNGVWIGAKSILGPGSVCRSHSILSLGSTYTGEMEEFFIYQGNPAQKLRKRMIT